MEKSTGPVPFFEGGETIAEIARVWRGEVESTRSGGRYEDPVTTPESELRRRCGTTWASRSRDSR